MRAGLWIALWAGLSVAPASADWTYQERFTDPIDGFETRAAHTATPDGYTLHLYRNPAGRVYALMSLPAGAALPRTGPVATLTPEGFPPKAIEARDTPGRVVEYAVSTGAQLRDRLWHGEGRAPAFGTLKDMLDAPAVTAAFLTIPDPVTVTWDMAGAALPIARALGLSLDGVPAGALWEDAAAQALLAAMTACQIPSLDIACVQKVTACSTEISEARDIDRFDACIDAPD